MSEDPLIHHQLDEYYLEALLGQGGMARVYRGLDLRLKRYAAIKVIGVPFRTDAEYIRRFALEAQAIAQLDHPSIVGLYRYGEADGVLYMAMQYIEGSNLQNLLLSYEENGEFMTSDDILRIIGEVCRALDYAHSKGVIHRDIKPSNIMLNPQGRTFLTDFGLALLLERGTAGEVFGTPEYIAPEQAISSAGVVPQSDFYALGVILYRMFTGTVPFYGDDALEIAMRHMSDAPKPPRELRPEISPALEAVILKALAKEPMDRFANGEKLTAALALALQKNKARLSTNSSRMTMVERVSLYTDELPPLPIVVAPAARVEDKVAATVPPPAEAMTTPFMPTDKPKRKQSRFSALIGAAGAIVSLGLLTLCLGLVLIWLNNRDRQTGPPEVTVQLTTTTDSIVLTTTLTAAAAVNHTLSPTSTSEGYTISLPILVHNGESLQPASTVTLAATSPALTPTPLAILTPTPVPTSPLLVLVFNKTDRTLFITNLSSQAIALGGLRLQVNRGEGESFSNWQLAELGVNECVYLSRRERDATEDISGTACTHLVGNLHEFNWADDITVFYNENNIGNCAFDRNKLSCTFFFVP